MNKSEAIRAMKNDGAVEKDIAEAVGVNVAYVYQILSKARKLAGMAPRKRGRPPKVSRGDPLVIKLPKVAKVPTESAKESALVAKLTEDIAKLNAVIQYLEQRVWEYAANGRP